MHHLVTSVPHKHNWENTLEWEITRVMMTNNHTNEPRSTTESSCWTLMLFIITVPFVWCNGTLGSELATPLVVHSKLLSTLAKSYTYFDLSLHQGRFHISMNRWSSVFMEGYSFSHRSEYSCGVFRCTYFVCCLWCKQREEARNNCTTNSSS